MRAGRRLSGLLGAAAAVWTAACGPSEHGSVEVRPASSRPAPDVGATLDARVVEGDVEVKTEEDVRHLAGITAIRGRLAVVGSRLRTLEGLEALAEVGGLLVQGNAELTSLLGAGGLVRVRGDVVVAENPALVDVDGLARLDAVDGTVRIGSKQTAIWNAKEKRLDGVTPEGANARLARVRLPALAHARGLAVLRNPVLATIDLPRLTEVDGDVEIAWNPRLPNLSPWGDRLRRVGGALIVGRELEVLGYWEAGKADMTVVARVPSAGQDALQRLELPALESAASLVLEGNEPLREALFPALAQVGGGITFQANPSLGSIDLPQLRNVGGDLVLERTPAYFFRSAITAIAGSLRVAGAERLASLRALGGLTSLGGALELVDDPSLRDLTALAGLKGARLAGLRVSGCATLPSLAGLEGVERVTGGVDVSENAKLADVSALGHLVDVGADFWVLGNPVASLELPALARVGLTFQLSTSDDKLTRVAFPGLVETGLFSVDAVNDPMATFAFPALRRVRGDMHLLYGPRTLAGVGALERIEGRLDVLTNVVAQAELTAWVDAVKARGGIGGPVQAKSFAP